ncbi:MAG: RebB family R body protein [Chitinophagaceae bacterium]
MTDNYMLSSVADLQQLLRGNTNSQSIAILNNVMAETIGMSMHNAVTAQHNAQMLNSATTTSTCARILSVIGAGAPPPPPPPPPAPTPLPTPAGPVTPTQTTTTTPTTTTTTTTTPSGTTTTTPASGTTTTTTTTPAQGN